MEAAILWRALQNVLGEYPREEKQICMSHVSAIVWAMDEEVLRTHGPPTANRGRTYISFVPSDPRAAAGVWTHPRGCGEVNRGIFASGRATRGPFGAVFL